MATLTQGRIASAPDADDRVMVSVATFDPNQQLGPCIYMPRGATLPAAGDACLVAFVDGGDAWVVAFDA